MGKFQKCWIWFWYNDITRIFLVLIPTYCVLLVPLLLWFNLAPDIIAKVIGAVYLIILVIASVDSSYSNLRKIGLDENRKKLKGRE